MLPMKSNYSYLYANLKIYARMQQNVYIFSVGHAPEVPWHAMIIEARLIDYGLRP